MKEFIKFLLTAPEANSRFVFLLHGFATALGILVIAVWFPFAHDRAGFPSMVAAIGGGGVGAALGRLATKWGDGKQSDSQDTSSK